MAMAHPPLLQQAMRPAAPLSLAVHLTADCRMMLQLRGLARQPLKQPLPQPRGRNPPASPESGRGSTGIAGTGSL